MRPTAMRGGLTESIYFVFKADFETKPKLHPLRRRAPQPRPLNLRSKLARKPTSLTHNSHLRQLDKQFH